MSEHPRKDPTAAGGEPVPPTDAPGPAGARSETDPRSEADARSETGPRREADIIPAEPATQTPDQVPEQTQTEAPADTGPAGGQAAAEPDPGEESLPARRSRRRDPQAASLIGVLTLLLGFAFAVQVRSTDDDQALAGTREQDLVRILDDLTGREDRLRQQIAEQRAALDQLGNSGSQSAAALEEARQRAEALGILNGTVAAQGPGLELTIRDPMGRVTPAIVLDAIQELRGAGAETMQIDDVRVGVSTAVTGDPADLRLDGIPVDAPYTFRVIGSPEDMATAMNIPGGVVDKVRRRDGTVDVVQLEQVVVDALRPLDTPQYAEPADGD